MTASRLGRLRDLIALASLRGEFRLASGRTSGYFFDLKRVMFEPEGAALLGDLLFELIRDDPVEYIGGLETGAIPLVALVCARSWPEKPLRGFFVRKAQKDHGADRPIDGLLAPGAPVIVIEDVTTTGGSAMQAVARVRQFGCPIVRVVSVVDRLEGAEENFCAAGIPFAALFTRRDFE